jgi:hypothetical protein
VPDDITVHFGEEILHFPAGTNKSVIDSVVKKRVQARQPERPKLSTPKWKENKIRETAVSPISTSDVLKQEAGGLADIGKGILMTGLPEMLSEGYQGMKEAWESRTPERARAKQEETKQGWKKEFGEFKTDPYGYLLTRAPRALGQAAGIAITGKLAAEFPEAAKRFNQTQQETSKARITERLAPMTEGEPTAALVGRTVPGLGLTGKESMEVVSNAAKNASLKINAIENKILDSPHGPIKLGEAPISGKPVADSLRLLIDENMQAFQPRLAKVIEKTAATYEKENWTPRRMQSQLRRLNKEAAGIYSKPELEAALGQHDPRLKFIKEETDAVRNAYYDNLSSLTGEDLRDLKRMQSDLIGLQKATTRTVAAELKAEAEGKAHRILGPKDSLRRQALKKAAQGAGWGAGVGSVYEVGKTIFGGNK